MCTLYWNQAHREIQKATVKNSALCSVLFGFVLFSKQFGISKIALEFLKTKRSWLLYSCTAYTEKIIFETDSFFLNLVVQVSGLEEITGCCLNDNILGKFDYHLKRKLYEIVTDTERRLWKDLFLSKIVCVAPLGNMVALTMVRQWSRGTKVMAGQLWILAKYSVF